MTRQEKEILDKINDATKDIEVPESLQPENIQKLLEKKKVKRWKRSYTYGLAAASVALVLLAGAVVHSLSGSENGLGIVTSGESARKNSKGEFRINTEIASAEDYDQVYEYLESYNTALREENGRYDAGFGDGAAWYGAVEKSSSTDSAASMESDRAMPGEGYSDTNVRTEGVGEADIVKTDGTYLYALKDNAMEIAIVDTRNEQMKIAGTIKARENTQISEFYVDGNQLFVLGNTYDVIIDTDETFYDTEKAYLDTYDISDVSNPKLKESLEQSGRYHSSRYVDGYLYIFSNFYAYTDGGKNDKVAYVPQVNGSFIADQDIYLPPAKAATQYLVVCSVKADDPGKIVDQKAVLSEFSECYVSGNNIYVYENTRSSVLARTVFENVNQTMIRRISYKDGVLIGEAQGKINGYLNDSFSIDEYNGNLRIVATIDGATETTNAVYVLNNKLEIIGQITDLAEGETIYSARFMGDTGYFVTFRQTDPLFSVDLSDPENPEIIGTLKIPGFSEYLHFYGDNLLLGIGMDADEESGTTNGMKISMFDISDPKDVKEIHKYTMKESYYSDVFYDYRAVLIDYNKNMIGFSAYGNQEMYYIFQYDKTNGFNLEMQEEVNGNSWMTARGIYINDRLYIIKGNAIESYQIGDYTKIDDLLI